MSELGKRLSMRKTDKAGRLTGGNQQVQKIAELMSKSLSNVESTLEKMQELTRKASADNLTARDRLMRGEDWDVAEAYQRAFDEKTGMEYQGAANGPQFAHSEPKLITPTNELGFMFSRIDDMFSDIAGKLAASPISEHVTEAMGVGHAAFVDISRVGYSIQIQQAEEIRAMLQEADIIEKMND